MGSHGNQIMEIMETKLCIKAREVLAEVRSAGWLKSELHPELNRHRRHEMADICEAGNIERVWRVLSVAVAEVRLSLLKMLCQDKHFSHADDLEQPDSWHFRFLFHLPKDILGFIKEKIHEYMVAAVMADRTGVVIPEASAVWHERRDASLASLRQIASTTHPPYSPVRRPLWPL